MHTLLALAFVQIALASSQTEKKIAAPVPKVTPPLSIEGKYTLLSVADQPVGMGFGGPGGGGGGGRGAPGGPGGPGGIGVRMTVNSAYMVGPATITKNEITFEGNARVSPLVAAGPTTLEYTLDSTKSPMTIDIDTTNLRGKKSRSLGLVEIVGNRTIIAIAKEGEERPKTTDEAEGVTVYYLQKAPPPPHTEFRIVAMTVGKEEAAEKELNKLAQDGFELVSTTQPAAADAKSSVTTVHFLLKRTVKP